MHNYNKPFLLTRSAHQSRELITTLEKMGGSYVLFPCIEIAKPIDQATITFAVTHFNTFDLCIFTSANAVLPQFKNNLTDYHHPLFAIGPATAKKLFAYTTNTIIIPRSYSSEGLLALPELTFVAGLKIGIFTGENPKNLLQTTLVSRDAHVDTIYCYKRNCPDYTSDQINEITRSDYAGIVVISEETLNNLICLLKAHEDWLKKQPLLVISESMAAIARTHGFQKIHLMNDDNLWRLAQDNAKIRV